jgi:hypothetical protein
MSLAAQPCLSLGIFSLRLLDRALRHGDRIAEQEGP